MGEESLAHCLALVSCFSSGPAEVPGPVRRHDRKGCMVNTGEWRGSRTESSLTFSVRVIAEQREMGPRVTITYPQPSSMCKDANVCPGGTSANARFHPSLLALWCKRRELFVFVSLFSFGFLSVWPVGRSSQAEAERNHVIVLTGGCERNQKG